MEKYLIDDFKKKFANKTIYPRSNISTNGLNTNLNSNPLKYIYDEEFISSINGLSTSIKNYFQNNKLYLGNIKLISENIYEQSIFTKSVINDILLYFNQITKTRYSNNNVGINDKYLKEKMKLINDRFEKINEFKNAMNQNIKNCELTFLSFYEEAKNSFKKMKVIRTEKIENLNKNITINKNININKNIISTNNNTSNSFYKQHRTISHSPSNKIHMTNNNKAKIITKKYDLKVNTLNSSNNNNKINDDLNEIKNLKIKYIELLQENKKLKDDLSKMNKNNGLRPKSKINTVYVATPSKDLVSIVKRSSSAAKKNFIKKPLSIGGNINKSKKQNKQNSHSRTQTQTQSHITNTLSSLADDENNKLIKSMGKKSELIPNRQTIDKDNNILSLSKNSFDITASGGGGVKLGGMLKNNIFINLSSMVLEFLKEMKNLQENITKKVGNVKELKKNFEIKKRELKKYAEKIIENNLSSTYGGTNDMNINIISKDIPKIKSKEQSLKASSESLIQKDTNNIDNNSDTLIKEYELKNKEQINIIQSKEKEIEKMNNEINEKAKKIEMLEKELKSKEEKIKTEKDISNLKDEKLNSEKLQNKNMTEEITELKDKNKKIELELKTTKENLNNLEKINSQLNEIQNQQKKIIDDMNSKSKTEINKNNLLNKELDKYKLLDSENISLKNENMKLKQQITQCNSNLVTISNTNESIIHEKDKIIKNLSNNIKELNNQIDLLNNEISKHGNNLGNSNILTEEINSLRKSNDNSQQKIMQLQSENKQIKNKMAEIKSNYISHDEDFNNIKKLLTGINNKAETNLKKILDNEKKLDVYTNSNSNNKAEVKSGNDITNDKSIETYIKDINKNINEYNNLINEVKSYNSSLIDDEKNSH